MTTRLEELRARYYRLQHAMQSGVAFKMQKLLEKGERSPDTEPKHLRVGINASMVEHGALVGLLLEKKLITEEEYYEALIASMQKEVDLYKKELSNLYGGNVDLA